MSDPEHEHGRAAATVPQGVGLAAGLSLVMSASVLPNTVPSVLGPFLRDDLALSRGQVGLLISLFGAVGALASPVVGRLTDRLGASRVILAIFVLCALAVSVIASAPGYAVMLVGAVIAGLASAAGNPSTNAMVVSQAAAGARGVIVGIKQSGIQLGYMFSGLVLPSLAARAGWRTATWALLIVPVLGFLVSRTLPPAPTAPSARPEGPSGRLDPMILRLAVYAVLMGTAMAGVMSFLPLYSHEAVGFSPVVAGATVSVISVLGIGSRVLLGVRVERTGAYRTSLIAISAATMASMLVIAAAAPGRGALVFLGAALAGLSLVAWNAVGMLAVMAETPTEQVGRASGLVLLGFLGGMSVGPLFIGWSVDSTGSYLPAWLALALAGGISGLVVLRFPNSDEHAPRSGR